MKERMVVDSGSSVTFDLLKDLLNQLEAGERTGGKKGKTGDQLLAFLEGRNPFELAELEKVLPYAEEELESSYHYPEGFRILTPQEQVAVMKEHFPNLDASHVQELASGELPDWAECWAVIPKPVNIGKTYHEALAKIIAMIAKSRKFQNFRDGELTEKHLRLKEKTMQAHAKLNEQTGDFWVFPFQFGKKWRGHSVLNSQVRFADNEFGFGPYEVAILLLTHPDRITDLHQLYIDCAGCEYRPDVDGDFFACLNFYWADFYDVLGLAYNNASSVNRTYGVASGSLRQ